MRDLFASGLSEVFEESLQHLLRPARSSPDQPTGVMADHHGQVSVPAAVAGLIDPNPADPIEQVTAGKPVGDHPSEDPADTAPGHTHDLLHGRLRGMYRKPRGLLLKRARETRIRSGPGDRRHDHAMLGAPHPRGIGLQKHLRRYQVQRPPPAPTTPVIVLGATLATAATAQLLALVQPHLRDHRITLEPDSLDQRVLDTEHALE